jgi:hypothetical protein
MDLGILAPDLYSLSIDLIRLALAVLLDPVKPSRYFFERQVFYLLLLFFFFFFFLTFLLFLIGLLFIISASVDVVVNPLILYVVSAI